MSCARPPSGSEEPVDQAAPVVGAGGGRRPRLRRPPPAGAVSRRGAGRVHHRPSSFQRGEPPAQRDTGRQFAHAAAATGDQGLAAAAQSLLAPP